MKEQAFAKINICLNVVRRREDGYHELEMIMVPIGLHDVVTIEKSEQDLFTSSDDCIAMDGSNTVVKAVSFMRRMFSLQDCFRIHVDKKIPAQAGLAGGSADGAAVIRGIHALCDIPMPLTQLAMYSKEIGADVPFCVLQQCAIVHGIGESITPFVMHATFEVLLVKPDKGVPTKEAFETLDLSSCPHPNCEKVKRCLENDCFDQLTTCVGNSLEYSACAMVPEITLIKHELATMGLPIVLMSGSGSCVFALSQDKTLIRQAQQRMADHGYFTHVCEVVQGCGKTRNK